MQIRSFTPADTEAVLAIWLEASLQAHHFIDPAYWHANLAPMRETYLPAADSYMLWQDGSALGFYSLYEETLAACDFYLSQGFQIESEQRDPHTGCAEWVMVWSAPD